MFAHIFSVIISKNTSFECSNLSFTKSGNTCLGVNFECEMNVISVWLVLESGVLEWVIMGRSSMSEHSG